MFQGHRSLGKIRRGFALWIGSIGLVGLFLSTSAFAFAPDPSHLGCNSGQHSIGADGTMVQNKTCLYIDNLGNYVPTTHLNFTSPIPSMWQQCTITQYGQDITTGQVGQALTQYCLTAAQASGQLDDNNLNPITILGLQIPFTAGVPFQVGDTYQTQAILTVVYSNDPTSQPQVLSMSSSVYTPSTF